MIQRLLLFISLLFGISAVACAQGMQAVNPLQPPKGYKVALVEFADYECPDCANAEVTLNDAVKAYHLPLVKYDFPLPQHPWARTAAIMARYFDARSHKLGDEFRHYCYTHQPYPGKDEPQIKTSEDLRAAAEKFAAAHKMTLPLVVDPEGKLEAGINQDIALGREIGINHTPTIYIVTSASQSKPFVEVVDRTNLFSQIDEMIAEAGGVRDTPAPRTHKAAATGR